MENEILLETEELLQRLVEAVEKLNSAPSEDTIIAFFALVAAWITIAFLLVERHEKNRPVYCIKKHWLLYFRNKKFRI